MDAAIRLSKRVALPWAIEIALVVTLALALRTLNLLSLPAFFDESGYIRWAVDIWDQKTRAALFIPMTQDGKQPLFMWLAAPIIPLFSDPLLGARVVSAIAGVASALGVYFAGYWLAGRSVGLMAGLLYAAVPFNLFFDRMALVEGLLNAGGVWGLTMSAFLARRAECRREAAIGGVALGLALSVALWTKMTAVFALPIPVLCALFLTRRGKARVSLFGFSVGAAVLGSLTLLLSLLPGAENLVDKAGSFSKNPWELVGLPWDDWARNLLDYWSFIQGYFVAPLWWLLLASAGWALLIRRRVALLLLLCWAAATLPPTLLAVPKLYASRYVAHGVFPLLILIADFSVWGWGRVGGRWRSIGGEWRSFLVAAALLLAILAPTLSFDYRLLEAPEHAGLPPSDQRLYVTGWTAGYGFNDALRVVRQRAAELTKGGQPILLLSGDLRGTPYAALKVYLKDMPDIHHHVDMHLAHDPEGFMMAWKWHRVPILLVGNHGYDDLPAFERGVPQAKLLGSFPKPGGQSYFRVYEVAKEDLDP